MKIKPVNPLSCGTTWIELCGNEEALLPAQQWWWVCHFNVSSRIFQQKLRRGARCDGKSWIMNCWKDVKTIVRKMKAVNREDRAQLVFGSMGQYRSLTCAAQIVLEWKNYFSAKLWSINLIWVLLLTLFHLLQQCISKIMVIIIVIIICLIYYNNVYLKSL